jgi:hypothetical protein
MARRVAFKRLSAVEVDPSRSNQHEFNATRLRRELGIADEMSAGELEITVYLSDDPEDVVVDRGRYTLYDSRKGNPTRSPEYRLYYYETEAITQAAEGDLLVVFPKEPGSLVAIVAKGGTRIERELARALIAGDDPARFSITDDPHLAGDAPGALVEAAVAQPAVPLDYPELAQAFIDAAVASGVIPGSRLMAEAAQTAVLRGFGTLGPDLQLYQALEAETDIYFALEERIQGARLAQLQDQGASLTEILSFAQSLHQSRKSRRGQSLQNHFAYILDREGIPYTAQCETESGERPDFVFPGYAEYHDPDFPAERLRMVACKTTAKERWRQVLNEAQRIDKKILLTVDRTMTEETITAMGAATVGVHLPAPILAAVYPLHASLGSVSDLIALLTR